MSRFHTFDAVCPGCEKKLETAHPYMATWWRNFVKPNYSDAHISDSFRNEMEQNKAVVNGASELHWPNSRHNRMKKNSNGQMVGCSEALDLFQIMADGTPIWSPRFYATVAKATDVSGYKIRWGGTFKRFKDGKIQPNPDNPHFEMMYDET